MAQEIYVNLPIGNIKESIDFFSKLGFRFNQQFTDQNAACMIIGENIYAMLLTHTFFNGFIPKKQIADTSTTAEVLVAISAQSRMEVDEMVSNAIKAGGSEYREVSDHGWMYGRAFQDLDGHIWEVLHMDLSKMPINTNQNEGHGK
jgi:uncharacterized protein